MSHAIKTKEFLKDEAKADWHNQTLTHISDKRNHSIKEIDEWEELRELASTIKDNVLANLDKYLLEFEKKAEANGVHVHWANDAAEHNILVKSILEKHKAKRIVKSKSILTEECKLNHYLEDNDYEIIDTDLGERIVQLAETAPSHIVLPAIHLKRTDISELFHKHLKTEKGNSDPVYLTTAARQHLRNKFLQADAAITGVNFAIAETGGFVVCTNEGNADMGVHLAPVHIACMGIEKIIPQWHHLGVFIRLLARSATGQSITNYTSHFHKPEEGKEIHIILVDNGRTKHRGRPKFRSGLKCIRCGACMNTCPIYRRSGGYSYDATVPGPIGSILSPGIDLKKHKSLPFASTLCGACSDVCPVKIDIHKQLFEWRQVVVQEKHEKVVKTLSMKIASKVFATPWAYSFAGKIGRAFLRKAPEWVVSNKLNKWTAKRDFPRPEKYSFKDWYIENRNGKE